MNKEFYCQDCKESFLTLKEMLEHFRSREHKVRSSMKRAGSIMDKFTKHFKGMSNGSNKI